MLKSDLCDSSDAYVVYELLLLQEQEMRVKANRCLAFKNDAAFISCILKINNMLIDNAEDLDVAMPMYNLIEYSKNYRKTTGSLWNYYRDELTDDRNNNFPNKNLNNSELFKYKTRVTGSTYNVDEKTTKAESDEIDNPADDANKSGKKEVEIAVPLKYLNKFWRT